MDPIKTIDAPTLSRGTIPMVMGKITAQTLSEKFVVPRRDFQKKEGYQREVSVTRVKQLMTDLDRHAVDLPTAVLLSLRDFRPDRDFQVRDGVKYFQPEGKLYVVDGQHRVEALRRLIENDAERWKSYEVPFICMLGADERKEMEQFYIVNSTAKSVRTDLAFDLLKQRAERDADLMSALIERQESWKVKAESIVEALAQRSTVWQHRIRFPGHEKGTTVINNSGLAASLKPVLDTAYFGGISQDNQLLILDAYWQAIKQLLPEAFEDPTKFALQKSSPGAWVMHSLLIWVLEYLRSQGKSVIDRESYLSVLENVFSLDEDNAEGNPVSGSDFWRSGPLGAAGAFASHGGRRVMLARMRAMLPELRVE